MALHFNSGICFENIVIDPSRANGFENVLITHAHSDHVNLNAKSNFFFSNETHALIESRFEKVKNANSMEFGKKFLMGEQKISLHNSGHILGSSQVFLEGDNGTTAVTSDFKLQDSLVQKKAEILKCDSLVIESTFGLPCYKFPERKDVYEEIAKWISEKTKKNFVVLAGYALGKAQELTAICSRLAGIAPIVHESIWKNNKVYEKFGVNLGSYLKLEHNLKDSSVLIMPPSLVEHHLINVLEHSLRRKVFSAFATGWKARGNYSKIFTLSDHADFSQLMEYVQEAKPKQVFTMHGHSKEFSGYVQRRLGISAKPLEETEQKMIQQYC